MSECKFAAAICCIDGRFHEPLVKWIKKRFDVDFVDLITDAGSDLILAEGAKPDIFKIKERVEISVEAHKSTHLIVAAHENCAGNPVAPIEHCKHLQKAKAVIKKWGLPVTAVFVYIDIEGNVEDV